MSPRGWLVAGLLVSASSMANAASLPNRIFGGFADGNTFVAIFENDPEAQDRQTPPDSGRYVLQGRWSAQGKYGFRGSTDYVLDRELAIFIPALGQMPTPEPDDITFVFNGFDNAKREMEIRVTFAYFGDSADQAWNGDLALIGSFIDGEVANDFGYNSAITAASIEVVPLPVSAALFGSAVLGLGLWRRSLRGGCRAR